MPGSEMVVVRGIEMSKFYLSWKLNLNLVPRTLTERIRLWQLMQETIRKDLRFDALNTWGIYDRASAGFSIVEGEEESVFESLKKWVPYFYFDLKPFLDNEIHTFFFGCSIL
jgi:hypothetical protein